MAFLFRQECLTDKILGLFLIQPIIRFVFVLSFLLLERILSENAVVKNCACRCSDDLAENSTYLLFVPLSTAANQKVVCARKIKNITKKDQPSQHHHHGFNMMNALAGSYSHWHPHSLARSVSPGADKQSSCHQCHI
jgi:hypothetical protein